MTPPYKFSPLAQVIAGKLATPTFTQEGNYTAASRANAPYAKPGPYQTQLPPGQQLAYQAWLAQNHVTPTPDYDMAGYFAASHGAPHQQGTHYPDTFKTPLDTSFSNQSRYAKPNAPAWQGDSLINQQTQQTVYADKPGPPTRQQLAAALAVVQKLNNGRTN